MDSKLNSSASSSKNLPKRETAGLYPQSTAILKNASASRFLDEPAGINAVKRVVGREIEDEISDPEEDSLAGQMAMMRGGSVKRRHDEESDDESTTDDDQSNNGDGDSSSDSDCSEWWQ